MHAPKESGGDISLVEASEDFFTLEGKNVAQVPSSYSHETENVREMEAALRNPEVLWPGFWYEIMQGAWTHNDWSKGPPKVLIYYEGSKRPVDIWQFIQHRENGRLFARAISRFRHKKVERVEVRNHIKDDTGLEPHNLLITRHEEKMESRGLGVHGEGLKNAMAVAACTDLAQGFSAQSWTPSTGAWYGEAKNLPFQNNPNAPQHVHLCYHSDTTKRVSETVITVTKPDEQLLATLARIDSWFLPINKAYRFQNIHPEQRRGRMRNRSSLATIFVEQRWADLPGDVVFPQSIIETAGQEHLYKQTHLETPRVEVLAGDVLRLPKSKTIEYVFVDGLRVQTPGSNFANMYHFVGWGAGDTYGYNPSRSGNSRKIDGGFKELLAVTLAECTDYRVFTHILRCIIQSSYDCVESSLPNEIFQLLSNPAVVLAVRRAFVLVAGGSDFITESASEHTRASAEGLRVSYVPSKVWFKLLLKVFPAHELRSLDDYYFEQRMRDAVKLKAQAEALEALEKQNMESLFLERGYTAPEEKKQTGDVIMLALPKQRDLHRIASESLLLHAMATRAGQVVSQSEKGIRLQMNMVEHDFPEFSHELGELLQVISSLSTYLFDGFAILVTYFKNGEGIQFSARCNPLDSAPSKLELKLSRSKVKPLSGQTSIVELEIIPHNGKSRKVAAEQFSLFRQELTQAVSDVSEGGAVSLEKYRTSNYARRYPITAEMLAAQRAIADQLKLLQEAEARFTRERARLGLPPPGDNWGPDGLELSQFNIGGLPFDQCVMQAINPTVVLGMNHSETPEPWEALKNLPVLERIRQTIRLMMMESMRKIVTPDITVISNEANNRWRCMQLQPSPFSTGRGQADVQPLPALPFYPNGLKAAAITIHYNKPVMLGNHSLLVPTGYKPIGFRHPDGEQGISFLGNEARQVYSIHVPRQIDHGLEIFYGKTDTIDTSPPTANERAVKADLSVLPLPWQNLIEVLRADTELDHKQKCDVLIVAWLRRQHMTESKKALGVYGKLPIALQDQTVSASERWQIRKQLTNEIIDKGIGDCAYIEMGLEGLISLLGIPTQEVHSVLVNGPGGAVLQNQYHAIVRAYLGGRWVAIEAQAGYIEKGFSVSEISKKYKQLISPIPDGSISGPKLIARAQGREMGDAQALYLSLSSQIVMSTLHLFEFIVATRSLRAVANRVLGEFDAFTRRQKMKYLLTSGLIAASGVTVTVLLPVLGAMLPDISELIDGSSVSGGKKQALETLATQQQSIQTVLDLFKLYPRMVIELVLIGSIFGLPGGAIGSWVITALRNNSKHRIEDKE